LLPFAGLFVGAMNTACPTARAFLPCEKFLDSSPDAPNTSLFLFCIFNPADELVSGDWRQVFPEVGDISCFDQRID